jgi:hypothetical protein
MVRSVHAAYVNINFGVLENCTVHTQEKGLLYGTYVGKRTHTKAHSTMGDEHKKYKCKKKIPLSPQVHTTNIPQDLRVHMDKSAYLANI